MGKVLRGIGMVAVAATGALVAYLYTTDVKVKQSVDYAMESTRRAVAQIKKSAFDDALGKGRPMSPTEQNQAWAQEQWDSLGI